MSPVGCALRGEAISIALNYTGLDSVRRKFLRENGICHTVFHLTTSVIYIIHMLNARVDSLIENMYLNSLGRDVEVK